VRGEREGERERERERERAGGEGRERKDEILGCSKSHCVFFI